ncbi:MULTISPECIES: hypothetical protein [unclassified Pseudomonas]|uniref:hypothetical protein n=1 Tax=unclassified Pseudomonas TaxID=196821 RepID=UPI002AC9BBEF|nr:MULTISPECIES: hypothetical protein [unclassified Pseudomonas]MEB0039044.1 hypothetical protein [Pseudomonas sp. MH10]MEB0075568.1 hypothetical protein [Pseudomonas sp. MH10out]MEB0094322.1 hypothetical protein [Pseudomonas sp. CCI4.2]MEB0103858.1 hypothetical protein [Pseudomonas sp. CCI3.2]MEB0120008.1 hypothetical protein [Pseudomonas sp. CCI1.2]
MAVLSVAVVLAIYAAGAYRIEEARQAPRFSICTASHCAPQDATFAGLSLK